MGDPELQLVAVKVLTNLSLDPSVTWAKPDSEAIREVLEQTATDNTSVAIEGAKAGGDAAGGPGARQQLLELSQQLLARLPESGPPRMDEVQGPTQDATGKECICCLVKG